MEGTWGKGQMRHKIDRPAWGASPGRPQPRPPPTLSVLHLSTQRLGLLQKTTPQLQAIDTTAVSGTQAEHKHITISFAFFSPPIVKEKSTMTSAFPEWAPIWLSRNLPSSLYSLPILARKKKKIIFAVGKINFEIQSQDVGFALSLCLWITCPVTAWFC